MTGRGLLPVAVVLGAASAFAPAFAQSGDWSVTGSNTLRLENYRIEGNPAAGPYLFGGRQAYDELNLDAQRQLSPYDLLRFQFYGVANDSDYRSRYRGLVPERINFTRENGDVSVPYRLEIGDFFSAYSFRTLQRGLKGAQVELQPQGELFGARHSVLMTAGTSQLDWRNLHSHVDDVTGASWLMDFSPRTRLSANVVHDRRRADDGLGLPERRQNVLSAAGSTAWDAGAQRLRLEAELGTLHGDHNGFVDGTGIVIPDSGRDRRGRAAFMQLSGQSGTSPLDYRLRYERYDRDYQPANALIAPNHKAAEAHAGWLFGNGLSWRARAQHFVDGMQSGNALRNNFYGTSLGGPLFGQTTGSLDLFSQDSVKDDRSIDRRSWNLVSNLSHPLPGGWLGNLGLQLQQLHDRVPGAPDTRLRQVQLSGTRALRWDGWTGSITPGVRWRRASGDASGVREWAPQLAVALASGRHTVAASIGTQRLVPLGTAGDPTDVNMFSVDYRYAAGRHTFGVEASVYDKHAVAGQANKTYRTSVFWTYHFEQVPALAAAAPVAVASPAPGAPAAQDLSLLAELAPGASVERALARLSEAGIRGGTRQGDSIVFEARLLRNMPQRQRLVLETSGDTIRRAALVIEFTDANNGAQVARDYEEARRSMLDRFGPATLNFEDGAIGPSFVADLNMGRVVRVMQWTTQAGALRVGIPRRLDGQARIEIQHAASFGPPRDGLWSVESVR